MSNTKETMESKVETVDINIDEIFNGTATAEGVTLPENDVPTKGNIFSNKKETFDDSFTQAEDNTKVTSDNDTEITADDKVETKEKAEEVFDDLAIDGEETLEEEEQKETRGRKPINGIADVFDKLIKDDKIVPFDDDKSFEDYTAKDWQELIEANLEERARQVRSETPKQFFQSLPEELQIAARYVAEGGTDMKGLFATLAATEEIRTLDVSSERDQEKIIFDYLSATGYGTAEEIAEEIEVWKDLGKLEQQAHKFKPKLDKMQEHVVAQKLEEQEMKKKQQEQASKQYMENVYNTLKEGSLGDIKVDRKVQAMLYNGLVQPNYPSVSGKSTNLLGHLLEKYQFVEPNYPLIAEALWLLADPKGYKSKIMDKGAQASVESTVRKLKTEQVNSGGSSLGVDQKEKEAQKTTKRKIPRANNIFKRF